MSNILSNTDIRLVLSKIPKDVVAMLREDSRLVLAGGIIRALIGQERPHDIDVFGDEVISLTNTAQNIVNSRQSKGEQARLFTTGNAITVYSNGRLPLQFITRWTFTDILEVINSFDYTVCQAAISYDSMTKQFRSICSDSFYADLAAKRLVYTSPVRVEDTGGSLMRAIKYVRRGYSIDVENLAAVCSRLMDGMNATQRAIPCESRRAEILKDLLSEVYPTPQIEGVEN